MTAIHLAAKHGHTQVLDELKKKISVKVRESKNKMKSFITIIYSIGIEHKIRFNSIACRCSLRSN